MTKRVAIYVRSSVDLAQSVDSQIEALRGVADAAGWQVVAIHEERIICGSKGRDRRPALDALLYAAAHGKYDLVAVHSICKIGRHLSDLISVLQKLDANGVGFYSHFERLDSSMAGSIFEFTSFLQQYERSQRRERVIAGQQRSRGLLGTRIGRPPIPQAKMDRIRTALEAGGKIRPIARQFFVSATTVLSVKKSLIRDDVEPEAEAA